MGTADRRRYRPLMGQPDAHGAARYKNRAGRHLRFLRSPSRRQVPLPDFVSGHRARAGGHLHCDNEDESANAASWHVFRACWPPAS
jgi:hypothetical protein